MGSKINTIKNNTSFKYDEVIIDAFSNSKALFCHGTYKGYNFRAQYHTNNSNNIPIVFLGGAFQSNTSWDIFINYFYNKAPVASIDIGVPDSQGTVIPHIEPFEFLSESLKYILKNLPGEKYHIASASYGTPIAFKFAIDSPDYIDSLLLSGTMNGIPKCHIETLNKSIFEIENQNIDAFIDIAIKVLSPANPTIEKQQLSWRLLKKAIKGMNQGQKNLYVENTKRLIHYRDQTLYKEYEKPCTIFTGEFDSFTTPQFHIEASKILGHANLFFIKNADHLFQMQKLESTINLIEKTVSKQPITGNDYITYNLNVAGVNK